jgi:hypothetical protein
MNSHRLTRFRWEFIRWGGTACCAGRVQPTALSLRFSTLYSAQRRLDLHCGPRRAAADASRWASPRCPSTSRSPAAWSYLAWEMPPQNYRRSRRAYSPAPATCSGVRCRSRSAGERAGAPARSCPSGDAVPLRARACAHSTRLACAVGRREPGQNGRTRRPRARSSSLQATPTPVAAQHLLQPTALSLRFSIIVLCQPSVAIHAPVPAGRPAERHRWAGGFLWLRLQFASSALASTDTAGELLCRSSKRVGHLLSSKRRGAPATHR